MSAADFPWSVIPEPRAGELQRGVLRWQDLHQPAELTYAAIRGATPGPSVLIHIAPGKLNFPAVQALFRLVASLQPERLSGSLLCIPHPTSPHDYAPFPGSAGGSPAERRTHHLARDVFAPADAMIELAGYPAGEYGLAHACFHRSAGVRAAPGDAGSLARAVQLDYALAMNLSSDRRDAIGWFARRDRPAVRLVLPDIPSMREDMTVAALTSLTNMLRHLGALRGPAIESGAHLGTLSGVALALADGLWEPAVQPGDLVDPETPLGAILTLGGELQGRLITVRRGVVLSISTAVQVSAGERVVWLIDDRNE